MSAKDKFDSMSEEKQAQFSSFMTDWYENVDKLEDLLAETLTKEIFKYLLAGLRGYNTKMSDIDGVIKLIKENVRQQKEIISAVLEDKDMSELFKEHNEENGHILDGLENKS